MPGDDKAMITELWWKRLCPQILSLAKLSFILKQQKRMYEIARIRTPALSTH